MPGCRTGLGGGGQRGEADGAPDRGVVVRLADFQAERTLEVIRIGDKVRVKAGAWIGAVGRVITLVNAQGSGRPYALVWKIGGELPGVRSWIPLSDLQPEPQA